MSTLAVLHVAETLPGGPATYINELTHFQVAEGWRVDVLVPEPHKALVTTPGVGIHTFARRKRSLRSLVAFFRELMRVAREGRYDVIHLHSTFAGLVGRIMPRRSVSRVYCPHGWAFAMSIGAGKKRLYAVIERLLARRCEAIVTISHGEADLARWAGIARAKCVTITNGIRDRAWRALAPGASPRKALFVGRYDYQKGIDILFDASAGLRAMGLDLCTIGGQVVGGAVEALVFPEGVRDLGWMPTVQVSEAIDAADVVIMPSRWEGMPLVGLEAMRSGRPILGADVNGVNEIVSDGVNGCLFEGGSASALLAAMTRMMAMDMAGIGAAGRRRYEELYTAERMHEQTKALYYVTMENR